MARMTIPTRRASRKRVGAFRGADVRHDESTLDFSTAAICYNFDCTSGALRDGYGVRHCDYVPPTATKYWVFKYFSQDHNKFVEQYIFKVAENNYLWFYDTESDKTRLLAAVEFDGIEAVQYRLNSHDVLLISAVDKPLFIWDGMYLNECYGSPVVSSMALHYERLFVIDRREPTKIFFSDNLDITNWNFGSEEGGFIELLDERGELNKVVSFGNYLYIFREHGISRVTAFGDQSEFAVIGLFTASGRIFPSSIAKCGNCIMFLASDGLYTFDGYDCTKRVTNLEGLIKPDDNCVSAYFDGKYYLACKMDFADGAQVGDEHPLNTTNALIVFDVTSGEVTLSRGMNITFMNSCTFNGHDFIMAHAHEGGEIARCGKLLDTPLEKLWRGALTDLGMPDRTKSVREVYTDGKSEFLLTVSGERKTKNIVVPPGFGRRRVNLACKKLSVSVFSCDEEETDIKPPTVIFTTH